MNNPVEDILAELDAMAFKYDTHLLAAVMASRSARMYGMLRSAGFETPDSITRIYGILLETAQTQVAVPRVFSLVPSGQAN